MEMLYFLFYHSNKSQLYIIITLFKYFQITPQKNAFRIFYLFMQKSIVLTVWLNLMSV